MSEAAPYAYAGDPALERRVERALRRVIDPELALDIVGLGLVYDVDAAAGRARVRMTMTSAACPVIEHIVDGIQAELRTVLGESAQVTVDVVWEPPWTPERMSARARAAMGWE